MNAIEEDKTIEQFYRNNNLIPKKDLTDLERSSILIVENAYYHLISEESNHFDRLGQNPIWGICSELKDRIHTYSNSTIANFIMGNHLSGEVLSRTATESSLGLTYILNQEGTKGFSSYIKNYILKENQRVQKWKNSASDLAVEEKDAQLAMANLRQFVIDNINNPDLWGNFDIDIVNNVASWPNIYGLFEKSGNSIDYRTVYAMMCSQVHSDAGDIINRIIARVVEITSNDNTLISKNKLEEKTFSNFMIHFSIRYYLEAYVKYSERFNLQQAKDKLLGMIDKENENLKTIANQMENIRG